jgi:hypothetical protein
MSVMVGGGQRSPSVVPNHRHQFATLTLESMPPTASKKAPVSKQQTLLNFKNVRRNASASESLKPSKPTLVTTSASKSTTKIKVDKEEATRASDVSSIESDEHEVEEVSEPEATGTEPSFEIVRIDLFPLSLTHN